MTNKEKEIRNHLEDLRKELQRAKSQKTGNPEYDAYIVEEFVKEIALVENELATEIEAAKGRKTIAIFHGMGGEPQHFFTNLFEDLGYNVIADHIVYEREWMKDQGASMFAEQLERVKDVDLIWSISLGSYTAYNLARALGKDVILINPALDRDKSTSGIGHFPMNYEPQDCRIECYFGEKDFYVRKEYAIDYLNRNNVPFTGHVIKNMEHGMGLGSLMGIMRLTKLVDLPVMEEELV